jgi:magnesium transporter
MVAPRRSDVVLDSVKRLLRIGATANLLNLLQKQHPADLAQIFGTLLDAERSAVFALLVERQPKLAMETISEMGPEPGAQLLTGRPRISPSCCTNCHPTMRPPSSTTCPRSCRAKSWS